VNVRIDAAGRLVLPKDLRRLVGLENGGAVEVTLEGTTLRLDPAVTSHREIELVDGWPVLTSSAGGSISEADVRALRDQQR
jgi:AbrB family looped-hinge helix DNA binding protein